MKLISAHLRKINKLFVKSITDGLETEEVEGAKLEEQLLQPPAAPTYVPYGRQSTRHAPRKNTAEEDELAELHAEMAL
ncbi:hypothetical protein Tco_0569542 [Tanacetum coccineum]